MAARVFALMARRAMGAVPVMQKKILAAQGVDAGVFENPAGKNICPRPSVEAVALFCGYHEQRPAPNEWFCSTSRR